MIFRGFRGQFYEAKPRKVIHRALKKKKKQNKNLAGFAGEVFESEMVFKPKRILCFLLPVFPPTLFAVDGFSRGRFKRKFCYFRAASRAGPASLHHPARFKAASAAARIPFLSPAILAVDRTIARWFKRKLSDFCSAVGAGPISLNHIYIIYLKNDHLTFGRFTY